MAIRIGSPSPSSREVVLIVEDDGGALFLNATLPLTSVGRYELCIAPGGGWSGVYRLYEQLLDSGVAAARIIPVLDADALGEKTPTSRLHANPNIFRFGRDFEFAFADEQCMLLDQALLEEHPAAFGPPTDSSAIVQWTAIVREGRVAAATRGEAILDSIESTLSAGGYPLGSPSKVALARRLAELCRILGVIPQEVDRLVRRIVDVAQMVGIPAPHGAPSSRRTLWAIVPPDTHGLVGEVVYSINEGGLYVLDLSTGKSRPLHGCDDIGGGASWSVDGTRLAGRSVFRSDDRVRTRAVIADPADGRRRVDLTQDLQEYFLCWDKRKGDPRCLVRSSRGVFLVSDDSTRWTEIDAEGQNYNHCLSVTHMARTPYEARGFRSIEVLDRNTDSVVQRVSVHVESSHAVSWSHGGDRLAFINCHEDRKAVCVYSLASGEVRALTPWTPGVHCITWSPDDKHLLFAVDQIVCVTNSLVGRQIIPVFAARAEPTLGCCSWK